MDFCMQDGLSIVTLLLQRLGTAEIKGGQAARSWPAFQHLVIQQCISSSLFDSTASLVADTWLLTAILRFLFAILDWVTSQTVAAQVWKAVTVR